MSSSEKDRQTDPIRQEVSPENSQIDHRSEFYKLGCVVLRLVILAITEACARQLGRRLEMLSQSAWIPTEGYGNTQSLAFLMNMTPRGAQDLAKRRGMPVVKPGDERIYHFPDLLREFNGTPKATEESDELPKTDQKPTKRKRKP